MQVTMGTQELGFLGNPPSETSGSNGTSGTRKILLFTYLTVNAVKYCIQYECSMLLFLHASMSLLVPWCQVVGKTYMWCECGWWSYLGQSDAEYRQYI